MASDWEMRRQIDLLVKQTRHFLSEDQVFELQASLVEMGSRKVRRYLKDNRHRAMNFLETSRSQQRILLRKLENREYLLLAYIAIAWAEKTALLLQRVEGCALPRSASAKMAIQASFWLISEYETAEFWMWPFFPARSPLELPWPDNDTEDEDEDENWLLDD
jgi:hypothetical protein